MCKHVTSGCFGAVCKSPNLALATTATSLLAPTLLLAHTIQKCLKVFAKLKSYEDFCPVSVQSCLLTADHCDQLLSGDLQKAAA